MTDTDAEDHVDGELFDSLAGDTLTVFKLVMTVLVLYGSILALVAREGSNEFVLRTLGSLYTNLGIQFLLGSSLAVGLLYGWIRMKIAHDDHRNTWIITDEEVATYALTSAVLGVVIAVFLLVAGILDGSGPGGIPITHFPVLLLPIILIVAIFDLLVLLQLFGRFSTSARDYLSALRTPDPAVEVEDANADPDRPDHLDATGERETATPDPAEEREGD